MAGFVAGYLAPGVYDHTLVDPNVASLLGGLRIPVIIGTGQEEKLLLAADVVRGSSASVDNKAPDEDVSSQADGTNVIFQVANYPIVTGTGSGVISTRPSDVIAKVNNQPVPVVRVNGTLGQVTLQLPPRASDIVTITYYFKLTDTKITNENIAAQADGTNLRFYTHEKPIVDGRGSGVPTTNISDVVVKVNGLIVTVSEVDGVDGYVVLAAAPLSTDTVTITYYFNQYANTYDLLPVPGLTRVVGVGDSPDLDNYIEGTDFIILDGNKIQWGAGAITTVSTHTAGSVYFDTTQISTLLVDDKLYKQDVSSQFTGTENSCVVLYTPIVDGNGRDIVTYDPAKVKAYVNGTEVTVTRVDGDTGTIYLATAPVAGSLVEVTYYRSQLEDDTYTLTVDVVGATGVGKYSITSASRGPLAYAKLTTTVGPVTPVFDTPLKASKNLAITETVTITFTSATQFTVTSSAPYGSGTGATSTGLTGRTYIDAVTGLQFTIAPNAAYNNTEVLTVDVSKAQPSTFTTSTSPVYSIPGVQLTVTDTANTTVSDTTLVQTFDKSGAEPVVGATYYMTYYYQKTDYNPKIFTRFKDVSAEYGALEIGNQITLTAFLMMINGAVAVMCKQILKEPGKDTASDQSFILALKELEKPVQGIKPRVIHPVTTSTTVIGALRTHLAQMSSERMRSERVAFIGYPVGTEPAEAREYATALKYSRIVAVYPDGAVINIADEFGTSNEYIVDGSYIAAAIVGLYVTPAFDIAEPLTRKQLTGFVRLTRTLDEAEMDDVASGGVTVIFDDSGVMKVRHSLTTDMSNPFTKAPNVQGIMDEVQMQARFSLDQYIGKKFLPRTANDVAGTLAATLSALKDAEIIADYTGVSAIPSDIDPNYLVCEAFYKPVFELSYIRVTFNVRAKL